MSTFGTMKPIFANCIPSVSIIIQPSASQCNDWILHIFLSLHKKWRNAAKAASYPPILHLSFSLSIMDKLSKEGMELANLIIGNSISLAAAVFTAKSSWAKDTEHIYFYQVIQCPLLAPAFFPPCPIWLDSSLRLHPCFAQIKAKQSKHLLVVLIIFQILTSFYGMIFLILVF